jgi:hypothetical protein
MPDVIPPSTTIKKKKEKVLGPLNICDNILFQIEHFLSFPTFQLQVCADYSHPCPGPFQI